MKAAGTGGILLSAAGSHYFQAGLGLGSTVWAQSDLDPKQPTGFVNSLRLPSDNGLLGVYQPTSNFNLTAKIVDQEIIPGTTTKFWVYEIEHGGKRYQNPVFRVRPGTTFAPSFQNQLGEESIIHWHGLHLEGKDDGHPRNAVKSGETYPYNFSIQNRAATYWYHPHPDKNTARQTYLGLSSLFIVEDEVEDQLKQALDLNLGETDIPLVLQDKRFSSTGSILYNPSRNEFFMGFLGNLILVNSTIKPFFDVDTRVYRFRILNGSNTRNYRLGFTKGSDQLPFYIIGNDGGLVDQPYQVNDVMISPAERVDILVDLRNLQAGDVVFLKNLGFDPMGNHSHGHDMPFQTGVLRGDDEFFVLKFNVTKRIAYDKPIPTALSEIRPVALSGASIRPFLLSGTTTQWFINNLRFNMEQIPITVNRNTVEIWEIRNEITSIPHPMHLHAFFYQILERRNSPNTVRSRAVDSQGRLPTDRGWKDTVLVWPGETVRAAIDFSHNFSGEQLYLFHCHILEHEDSGMMLNYRVV